jgi:hypothetical protein
MNNDNNNNDSNNSNNYYNELSNATNINLDLENQTFFIDGEYLDDDINLQTHDFSNNNSPLEKFKLSNFLFNNSSNNYLNFKKSQSYPNNSVCIYDNKKNVEMTQINYNPLNPFTKINENSDENLDEETELIADNNKEKCNYLHKFYNWLGLNKLHVKSDLLNNFISVILHIFIMVVFEIYFYFNFVIDIEKKQFFDKIQEYINKFVNSIDLNSVQKEIVKKIFNSKYDNVIMNDLYDLYIKSLEQQKKLLYHLMTKSCVIAGVFGLVLLGLVLFGMWKKIKIKWNWIWMENILMFALLGIFEYWFLMNVILNYNPITDAEIKYYIADQIVNYFNSTI